MTSEQPLTTNPYVGPSTFSARQAHLFFGREREARDLLARVISERLLLFYAQSGAGKSSLLYTRLIPQLAEKGFVVLPVGRVGGDLSAGVAQVDNIFVFNLMSSIDEGNDPQRLAHISLSDFLARLTRKTVTDAAGKEHKGWVYDATVTPSPRPASPTARRFILIVDQFEEIVTAHPASWQEREAFFGQLDEAMQAFPNLWVTLTLREDYVAALDPYAPMMTDRLRARFYMERMGPEAALQAVREPAALAGRPFAAGVAEKLVDDLRQLTVPGQSHTVTGQYVEPMQLQVVCYQLWETLEKKGSRTPELTGIPEIGYDDLADAGDVNKALLQFYDETIKAVLADPQVGDISENELRSWFDTKLITEAGTRGFVHRGKEKTGGLPNAVLRVLQNRFLVRVEERSGGAWVELVHDRFVEPIRTGNRAWFAANANALQSVLQRQAASWDREGRPDGMLLDGEALLEAERWAQAQSTPLEPHERAFLDTCRESSLRRVEYERRRNRRIRVLAVAASVIAVLALVGYTLALRAAQQARAAQAEAEAQATAAGINRAQAEVALSLLYTPSSTRGPESVTARPTAVHVGTRAATASARGTPVMSPQTDGPGAATAAAAQTVEAIQTQLAQSLVIQQGLAPPAPSAATPTEGPTATATVQPTATPTPPQVYAVIDGLNAAINVDPDPNATRVGVVVAPAKVPVLEVNDNFWVKVVTDRGEVGWLDGRWITYEGDASFLPKELRIRVTTNRTDLPFVHGVVVSYNGTQQAYDLLTLPRGGDLVGVSIPVGTRVTVLQQAARGSTTYGSGRWYLVTLPDPSGRPIRWTGYLPAEAVKEAQ